MYLKSLNDICELEILKCKVKEKEEIIRRSWDILEKINIPKDGVDTLTMLKEFADMSGGPKLKAQSKCTQWRGKI